MVAKKRKGILKKGLRRSEQGINPLLVALGAGAGAAGGAGMGARRAMQTEARVPQVAKKISKRAVSQFEAARGSASYFGRGAEDAMGQSDMLRRRSLYRSLSPSERIVKEQYDNEGARLRKSQGQASDAAGRVQRSGRMLSEFNETRINRKLGAVGNKASTRRTKRLAGKGAIKGGVLAALAQAVLAEMNKKKRD
jgi:hypothetical protein